MHGLVQRAEQELDAETIDALTLDLLLVCDPPELEAFLGKVGRSISRSVAKTAKGVGKAAGDAARGVAVAATAAAPVVASAVKFGSRAVPIGMLARASYGAIAAGLSGQNILGARSTAWPARPSSAR